METFCLWLAMGDIITGFFIRFVSDDHEWRKTSDGLFLVGFALVCVLVLSRKGMLP